MRWLVISFLDLILSEETVPEVEGYLDHDFLADVLCKVSVRFRRLATDYSLWKDIVVIDGYPKNFLKPKKLEFVVQKCLNSGTKKFSILIENGLPEVFYALTSPRFINPITRFPNLKLREVENDLLVWRDYTISEDEQLEAFEQFWRLVEC